MKGTSPSRASGEASTASRSGVKMEIPINIINQSRGEVMNKITTVAARNASTDVVMTIGIDLAKNVFARHGTTAAGKPVLLRPSVRREQRLEASVRHDSTCLNGATLMRHRPRGR
jgi:hypothetical protein